MSHQLRTASQSNHKLHSLSNNYKIYPSIIEATAITLASHNKRGSTGTI